MILQIILTKARDLITKNEQKQANKRVSPVEVDYTLLNAVCGERPRYGLNRKGV